MHWLCACDVTYPTTGTSGAIARLDLGARNVTVNDSQGSFPVVAAGWVREDLGKLLRPEGTSVKFHRSVVGLKWNVAHLRTLRLENAL